VTFGFAEEDHVDDGEEHACGGGGGGEQNRGLAKIERENSGGQRRAPKEMQPRFLG
jgi:hypothetical protein